MVPAAGFTSCGWGGDAVGSPSLRAARDFALECTTDTVPCFSPERPRIADPATRNRVAAYFAGGTPVLNGYRTDGLWLWPEAFGQDALEHGLGPEPDLLRHMQANHFQATAPAAGDDLRQVARAALLAGPPRRRKARIEYFVRVDEEYPPEAPLSLLRKVYGSEGRVDEEALWRDMRWHPTHTFVAHGEDYDLRPISERAAAEVMDRWCARWHQQSLHRGERATA
jgi:hypothetical protein